MEPDPGKPVALKRSTAVRVFAGLRESLRETDLMGWYQQDLRRRRRPDRAPRTDAPDTSSVIQQRVDANSAAASARRISAPCACV